MMNINEQHEKFRTYSRKDKYKACENFFDELVILLWKTHSVVSPNGKKNYSWYLVPKGTKDQITYNGKPLKSFRFARRWNWYANVKKCPDEKYIQCHSIDVPEPEKRSEPGRGTNPILATQVAIIDDNGDYHVVYGEKYDRERKTWLWVENNPKEIAALVA